MNRLGSTSTEALAVLSSDVRRELLTRRGSVVACQNCAEVFPARRGARFCSGTCRVSAYRKRRALRAPESASSIADPGSSDSKGG